MRQQNKKVAPHTGETTNTPTYKLNDFSLKNQPYFSKYLNRKLKYYNAEDFLIKELNLVVKRYRVWGTGAIMYYSPALGGFLDYVKLYGLLSDFKRKQETYGYTAQDYLKTHLQENLQKFYARASIVDNAIRAINTPKPTKYVARFMPSAVFVQKKPDYQSKAPVPIKKPIKEFTKKSQRNLLVKMQSIDWDYIKSKKYQTLFITLTYQTDFYFSFLGMDNRIVKKHLNHFFVRLKRIFDRLGVDWTCIYKLEFTKKFVPHFHLILITTLQAGKEGYKKVRGIVSDTWADVITREAQDKSEWQEIIKRIKRASTNTRTVDLTRESKTLPMRYVSKYVNKPVSPDEDVKEQEKNWVGRFWGIVGRQFFKKISYDISFNFKSPKAFYQFRRAVLRYAKSKYRSVKKWKSWKRFIMHYLYGNYVSVLFILDIKPFLNYYLDLIQNE